MLRFSGITWKPPADELMRSFTIVTALPDKLCDEIKRRIAVMLPPLAWPIWPGEKGANGAAPPKACFFRTLPPV